MLTTSKYSTNQNWNAPHCLPMSPGYWLTMRDERECHLLACCWTEDGGQYAGLSGQYALLSGQCVGLSGQCTVLSGLFVG